MPKGGHLHLHLTAAAPLDLLLEFTYQDNVYCKLGSSPKFIVDVKNK